MSATFYWQGRNVPFRPGESIASALARAGIQSLGPRDAGGTHAVFCGIGQCQGCLVLIDGCATEACLAQCSIGMQVFPLEVRDA